jgi:hypothetical protein
MIIITSQRIAKIHEVSIETAETALTCSWQITQEHDKSIDRSQVISDLFRLSSLFCLDCRDNGLWNIGIVKCKGCHYWHCANHVKHRRCQLCTDLQRLKGLLRKRR